jgi:hypothetical protein
MLPGSGGLECDIGGVGDAVSPKRGSLSAGMLEAAVMVRFHKGIISSKMDDIRQLSVAEWQSMIPARPEMPDGYFQDEEEEGEED